MALANDFAGTISLDFQPAPLKLSEPAGYATKEDFWWSPFPGATFYHHFHPAEDKAAPIGTVIHAFEASLVTKAGWSSSASGYAFNGYIRPGVMYGHGHLSKLLVRIGAWVERGQPIAEVGCSGSCGGPHSHRFVQTGHRIHPPSLFLPGGRLAGSSLIIPERLIAKLFDAGRNLRTTPDVNVGTQNLWGSSHADGIYHNGVRVAPLSYAFGYYGDVVADGYTWAMLTGFGRLLYTVKSGLHISQIAA
jgi:peptidase M23-like protein